MVFVLRESRVLRPHHPHHHLLTSADWNRFAGGKASALVVDVGASNISITPVHDGLILKKGSHLLSINIIF
jgi:actin-related protein